MVSMNFKKFKKKEGRSLSVEGPKLLKDHADFFNEIRTLLKAEEYQEWEEEALFFLFLKPTMNLDDLRPENLGKYIESAISFPKK